MKKLNYTKQQNIVTELNKFNSIFKKVFLEIFQFS